MIEYHDADGNPVSLDTLCRREPAWAANRIRALEERGLALINATAPAWGGLGEGDCKELLTAAISRFRALLTKEDTELPKEPCSTCSGTGWEQQECWRCNGTGRLFVEDQAYHGNIDRVRCPRCTEPPKEQGESEEE